ncbi:DegT/DnrJ/EryC1/StrS family aminotransferase [Lentisphaera profundi]|uniref:DegT/DnrJ/EryC1/StrS family aminotransferase n=1 Tax=Lentisphaera profundi TaxID=1658616 RepID=A0ABY7VT70_9BACT|nr:DegT/DnrJ/EryC1/StrS family aminotransferase [Lentisphaera profundi]WDE95964.1 DegT/DnrJ/EryC1/StrS family aminotransferase [Lentisphaera profundi]
MVKFNNFDRQYQALEDEIDMALKKVLKSGWYILGKELSSFEKSLASYVGTKYAVGVASGTDALILSLMCIGLGPGDEVITSDLTAYPTITAIQALGAIPIAVDVDVKTGLIDAQCIEAAISKKTKVIIPVHLYGQSCEMNQIMAIAEVHKLEVVEDCAQSIGAQYKGRTTGTFGRLSSFSFYPTKNLGAYGDAGAICTNSKQDYETLLELRNYGQTRRYVHERRGLNSRLDEMQAAILNVKLKYLDAGNLRRVELAKKYLKGLPEKYLLDFKEGSVFHLFPIKVKNRDAFISFMEKKGIETLIHYPYPVSEQAAFGYARLDNPKVDELTKKLVSLPIAPELEDEEIERVIEAVRAYGNE